MLQVINQLLPSTKSRDITSDEPFITRYKVKRYYELLTSYYELWSQRYYELLTSYYQVPSQEILRVINHLLPGTKSEITSY